MIAKLTISLTLPALLASLQAAGAQPTDDPRVADLVRAGALRVGLFSSQYTKDPVSSELKGVRPDLARALAARIGVRAVLIEHQAPAEVVACIKAAACDMAFLPADERAAAIAEFSFPFIQSEFTLLVPPGSAISRAADADQPGIRIVALRGHASTATLARVMRKPDVILEDDEDAAFELLRAKRVDAFASTRQFLLRTSANVAGARVLPDRYGAQLNRVVVPKGHSGWLAYANEFVEAAKASGLVQQAIDREGSSAFQVAPPGDSK